MDRARCGDWRRRRRPIGIESIDTPKYNLVLATRMTEDQVTIPLDTA